MNKKGFTLVELLAVIVILAIIALIATQIVINVIKKAQEGADARSVEGYVKAYESAYYQAILNKKDNETVNFGDELTVEYSGSTVTCEELKLGEDNKITATCTVNNKKFDYTSKDGAHPHTDSSDAGQSTGK